MPDDAVFYVFLLQGYFYTLDGHCIDKEFGERIYDLFFQLEREATELFRNDYTDKDLDLESWFGRRIEKEVSAFGNPVQRKEAQDILWGMTNYLKFHAGDELREDINILYAVRYLLLKALVTFKKTSKTHDYIEKSKAKPPHTCNIEFSFILSLLNPSIS